LGITSTLSGSLRLLRISSRISGGDAQQVGVLDAVALARCVARVRSIAAAMVSLCQGGRGSFPEDLNAAQA